MTALTEAQKRAVMALPRDGRIITIEDFATFDICIAAAGFGLITWPRVPDGDPVKAGLTPAGIALRAKLEQEAGNG